MELIEWKNCELEEPGMCTNGVNVLNGGVVGKAARVVGVTPAYNEKK